jgi:para-aminobenzoate synthetase component 2
MTRIFVLDNYDSFVYTIADYLKQLGAEVVVARNDSFSENEIENRLHGFDGVLISPGPGNPREAGLSLPMIRFAIEKQFPLLGVCLGHQALAEALGGVVTHAEELMHGKTSQVSHSDSMMFKGVVNPFRATRYHSLAVVTDTVPDELVVTAKTAGGVIMAVEHKTAPAWGVQFHPESVLTEDGFKMFGNWLELAGLTGAAERAKTLSPLIK